MEKNKMKQRTALILAAALTAFVLVLVTSITLGITSKSLAQQAASDPPQIQDTQVPPTNTAEVINMPLVTTPVPSATPTTQLATTAPSTTTFLTAGDATQAAQLFMPKGRLARQPGLVNYKGKMAYEVSLSTGTVYIDAFTGKVLGSWVAVAEVQPTITAPAATITDMPTDPPPADNSAANDGGGNHKSHNGGGQNPPAQPNPPPSGGGSGGHHKDDGGHKHHGGDD